MNGSRLADSNQRKGTLSEPGAKTLTGTPGEPDHLAESPSPGSLSGSKVAALYVDPDGVYSGLPDVEVWDEARDARLYDGPWPVVAHPPCARWSRLAGFTEARFGLKRGADGGCFARALEDVRQWGGVLEHPAYSAAWPAYGLPKPTWHGGWTASLLDGGFVCYVEQGRYGLPVKKATWLYAYGVELPELRWGFTPDGDGDEPNGEWGGIANWRDRWERGRRLGEDGFWSRERNSGLRASTPRELRDALLAMARTVQVAACA